MAQGVIQKQLRKAGAFADGELQAGQWGLDVSSGTWYYSTNGTTVVALGLGTGYIPTSQKGAANGVAELDAGGKVPTSQLPDTVLGAVDYQGTWNATTNSPNLGASSPTKGDYYVVATGGTTSLGGISSWAAGDWAIYNGTAWSKVDNTDAITSVFGRSGAVVAAASDYDASQIDNDSTVSGGDVAAALNTLNSGKAAASHTHAAADIASGDLATARMQTNAAAALQAGGGGTITNSALILDGGTI